MLSFLRLIEMIYTTLVTGMAVPAGGIMALLLGVMFILLGLFGVTGSIAVYRGRPDWRTAGR